MGAVAQSPCTGRDTAFNRAQELHFSVRSSTPARPDVGGISPISKLSAQLRRRLLASSFTSNNLARTLDSNFQDVELELEQDPSTCTADNPVSYCIADSVASQSPFHSSSAAAREDSEVASLGSTDSSEFASVPCIESLLPPIAFANEQPQTKDPTVTKQNCGDSDDDDVSSADIVAAPEMAAIIAPRALETVPSLQIAFSTRRSAHLGTSDPVLVIQEIGWESEESKPCEMYFGIFREFGES
jgi:hypothetical protein